METQKFNPITGKVEGVSETEELIQWNADTSRLMKIGLRTHNPDTMAAVHDRISEKFGSEFADSAIAQMITHLMTTENWSFFDENGNPSPLL